ncbi:FAD-dependent oxidoreductase, partial [Candidatus Gracilibacteria bacterium]|nr:FAD-dependent oxidoreductase [Candidatus Gracilibacteria bacterium]
MNTTTSELPIAIIGAGPVGLATAAHLAERNLAFVVLESGPNIGHAVSDWGHVQLFSPWRYCLDAAAVRLLAASGWQQPDGDSYPTGRELVDQYLAPLAAHPRIAPQLRLGQRVQAITRAGVDKLQDRGRANTPFELYLVYANGEEELLHARAVIGKQFRTGALSRHRNEETHAQRQGPQRRSAIGHERQRHALGRHQMQVHGHVDHGLQAKEHGKPRGGEPAERIVRAPGQLEGAQHHHREQGYERQAHHNAEFLRRDG